MKYWPFEEPFYPLLDSTGGPMDQTARFEPDLGVPITRRRTTARVDMWSMVMLFPTRERFHEFKGWFEDDLRAGSLPFVWRRPSTGEVSLFKFTPASYETVFPGGPNVRVSFGVLILPGKLWFAPYVPKDSARVPDWVADYKEDRYWIGQEEVSASDLDQISGDFLVLEQRLTFTQTWLTRTYAGDVPQTAPDSQVDWLAGFAE